MKLNKNNYYSPKNTYISSSKLKVFMTDKAWYKRKYIDYTEPQEMTDALIIGSAVDCLLTGTKKEFEKKFEIVDRRSSKGDNNKIQINATMLEKINAIVESVKRQSIWNDLKNPCWKKQVILTDDNLNICGMLDFLKIDKALNRGIIIDLKTSNTIDPKKYLFHCYDYGYLRQMAMYSMLVLKNYPQLESVDCYHLTVEKDSNNIYNCSLFQFDKSLIENEMIRTLDEIDALTHEEYFLPKSVGWADKIIISNFSL